MSNNLEAKITKQMRDLIEIKLAKQNKTPQQAIEDMDVFIQDFNSHEKYLINQYAKYVKHLIDNNYGTKNAWEKFLTKLEQKKLSSSLNKTINKENHIDQQAFKRSLEDLKEYDRISKILKTPSKKDDVEEIDVLDVDNNEVFNPFDENVYENEHDDWTLNSNEFDQVETPIAPKDLDTLERNINFTDTQDVEQLKEEFSKIKTKMQNKINDLSDQVDQLKFKLANYEIDKYGDYEIVDESDDEQPNEEDILKAQTIPSGQQTIDFSVDHTKDKLDDISRDSNNEKTDEDIFNKTEEQTMVLDDLDDVLKDDQGFEKTSEQTAVFNDETDQAKEEIFEKTSEQTAVIDNQSEDTNKEPVVFTEPEDGETTSFFKNNVLPDLDKALEELDDEETEHYPFDSLVVDKEGKEYHVAGTRKNSDNKTEYLVRDDEGKTFTFDFKDLSKKD